MFSVLIKGISGQHKQFTKYQKKHQAKYNLESALNIFRDSLKYNSSILDDDFLVSLKWGDTCRVISEPFGALIKATCIYETNHKKFKLNSLISESLSLERQAALINFDSRSHFTVTGNTRINGPIKVGEMGLQIKPFKGKAFTGNLSGPIISDSLLTQPVFNTDFIELSLEKYRDYLEIPPKGFVYFDHLKHKSNETRSNVYYSDNDIVFDRSNSDILKKNLLVVSKGNIILKDDVHFGEGSVFVSKESICLSDSVTGQLSIFYSPKIQVKDQVTCDGQFFASDSIIVSDEVVFEYPSILYLIGSNDSGQRRGSIILDDYVRVFGSIIYPNNPYDLVTDNGIIFVSTNAEVNGIIYCSNRLDFNGSLNGVLMTYQCYFYESPTHYLNWIRSGNITIPKNDPLYCLPIGFEESPFYQIIYYEEEVEILK